ncbi:MAG: hypothetical protein LBR54_01970, partial [Oscillospiraceae bacterium]|nr:hypothetical protein [Oscillospiraceae bacterium]
MKHLFGYIIMFFISAFLIYLGVQFLKSSWVTLLIAAAIAAVITEKNNMRDVDTFIFFKYIFKACVAVFLLSRTFDIVMAVFDVSQWIAS